MDVDELPSINPDVDYEQILPIQQKRIVAFINHFVMNTVSFLNTFCQSCESRLMQFEYKLQKVEASLLILESQLASIPDLNNIGGKSASDETKSAITNENDAPLLDLPPVAKEAVVEIEEKQSGPKACEDSRFMRFFKMVQFGVPVVAVKLKMQNEGVDPDILDKPNEVIPGFALENLNDTESSSNS